MNSFLCNINPLYLRRAPQALRRQIKQLGTLTSPISCTSSIVSISEVERPGFLDTSFRVSLRRVPTHLHRGRPRSGGQTRSASSESGPCEDDSIFVRQVSICCWAFGREANQCALRHSLRNVPLNDSMKALSEGFPGREKSIRTGFGAPKHPSIDQSDRRGTNLWLLGSD